MKNLILILALLLGMGANAEINLGNVSPDKRYYTWNDNSMKIYVDTTKGVIYGHDILKCVLVDSCYFFTEDGKSYSVTTNDDVDFAMAYFEAGPKWAFHSASTENIYTFSLPTKKSLKTTNVYIRREGKNIYIKYEYLYTPVKKSLWRFLPFLISLVLGFEMVIESYNKIEIFSDYRFFRNVHGFCMIFWICGSVLANNYIYAVVFPFPIFILSIIISRIRYSSIKKKQDNDDESDHIM